MTKERITTELSVSEAYEKQIKKERIEHTERMRQYEEDKKKYEEDKKRWEREKPNFYDYCRRITKFGAARLLNKVYKAREEAGLPPFTHAYDYPLDKNSWLAKKSFAVAGRYGANSNDIVFVPQGIEVTGWDHTTVIYVDDWERNSFVPAYSNTV